MSEQQVNKVSESDQQEIREARQQIAQAESRIAAVLSKYVGREHSLNSNEDISIQSSVRGPSSAVQGKHFEVIWCGSDPCGVYVDPPGVCAEI
jgi:hypothetical protein